MTINNNISWYRTLLITLPVGERAQLSASCATDECNYCKRRHLVLVSYNNSKVVITYSITCSFINSTCQNATMCTPIGLSSLK